MTDKEQDIKRYSFAIKEKYSSDDPISVVKASGEDTLDFLQGQFTQDVSKLSDSETIYGFLLTQKGRVLGDAFLRRIDEEHWKIYSWSLSAAAMSDRLEAYIIADDVELEDESDQWQAWRVGGSDEQVAALVAVNESAVVLDVAPALSLPWRLMVIPKVTEPSWLAGWEPADGDVFESARIAAGWPQVPADLGEGDFPSEGGRHQFGVSYTKGCYLGQEVMARLAATGRLRRGLAWVSGESDIPGGNLALVQNDKIVGELRSRSAAVGKAGCLGLAMMQLARFDAAQPVVTESGATIEFHGLLADDSGSED